MSTRPQRWREAAGAGLLVLADFTAVMVMLNHLVTRFQHDHHDVGRNPSYLLPSDLATPLLLRVWVLVVVNGLVLCVPQRTRVAGVGVLAAAAVIAIPVVAWVVWALATFSWG